MKMITRQCPRTNRRKKQVTDNSTDTGAHRMSIKPSSLQGILCRNCFAVTETVPLPEHHSRASPPNALCQLSSDALSEKSFKASKSDV
ncbi:hypothetical protein E2C01_077632 [Portunus trituberculatus]|uniref:Uncharacterized protein n=1 Tax=Portunus trituberculatus TaxID=210409 RepID=A0A5B7IKQ0_PORTR|nr:hypothetical protein [Portunus trituberculatus]